MEILNKLFEFVVDRSHNLSKRLLFIILSILFLIAIDRLFKFSDNYVTSQQIDQVEKIEKLLESEKVDTIVRKRLKEIEYNVLQRQTAWSYLADAFIYFKTFVNYHYQNTNIQPVKIFSKRFEEPVFINEPPAKRSLIWHTISSAWFFVGAFIIFPFVPILSFFLDDDSIDLVLIGFIFLAELFFAVIIFCLSAALSFIPIILNTPLINYIINAIIQMFILSLIMHSDFKEKSNLTRARWENRNVNTTQSTSESAVENLSEVVSENFDGENPVLAETEPKDSI